MTTKPLNEGRHEPTTSAWEHSPKKGGDVTNLGLLPMKCLFPLLYDYSALSACLLSIAISLTDLLTDSITQTGSLVLYKPSISVG